MMVVFHAYPGVELLNKKESPHILFGDGVYEETWLAPHTWRREVTFGDYRAVEVDGDGGRKMQSSSDYEPSRVLMLLSALLDPLPRELVSRVYMLDGVSDWKISLEKKQSIPLVHITKNDGNPRSKATYDFYFQPDGLLLWRSEMNLISKWENSVDFGGKVVSKHLSILAGERTLVDANVTIDAMGQVDPTIFQLPIKPADSWLRMRPFHEFEIKGHTLTFLRRFVIFPDFPPVGGFILWSVLDRRGRYREVELIEGTNLPEAKYAMASMRKLWAEPFSIDGKPCEMKVNWDMY